MTAPLKKQIENILFNQIRFYDKFGDKCPYCSFSVPKHYMKQNKPRSLATHMGKEHPEKIPNKVNLLVELFNNPHLKDDNKIRREAIQDFATWCKRTGIEGNRYILGLESNYLKWFNNNVEEYLKKEESENI